MCHCFLIIQVCVDDELLTIIIFITDLVRSIRDPEKPATLEDLDVVSEDGIKVCLSIFL